MSQISHILFAFIIDTIEYNFMPKFQNNYKTVLETGVNIAPHLVLSQRFDTERRILVECEAPKHFCLQQRPLGEKQ